MAHILRFRFYFVFLSLIGLLSCTLQAQENTLQELASQAGIIFSGRVAGVRVIQPVTSIDGRIPGAGVYEICFGVEWAGKGSFAGEKLTLRFSYSATVAKIAVGDHLLLFLRTPASASRTSIVDGNNGVFYVRDSADGRTGVR